LLSDYTPIFRRCLSLVSKFFLLRTFFRNPQNTSLKPHMKNYAARICEWHYAEGDDKPFSKHNFCDLASECRLYYLLPHILFRLCCCEHNTPGNYMVERFSCLFGLPFGPPNMPLPS